MRAQILAEPQASHVNIYNPQSRQRLEGDSQFLFGFRNSMIAVVKLKTFETPFNENDSGSEG